MSLIPGTRFGQYEVAALIGVGGMGEVYRATDTVLKRDVALKVLPQSFVTDANRLARLQREAEVLASLNHQNVAHIYGLERSDGSTAIVMELVEGASLADRIAQGALPPNEALNLALQIAAALEAAHERGMVHRDLKPQNIKLKPDGMVKVLDFGIAKALDARAMSGPQSPSLTTPSMTEAGVVLGTAGYMSPEQARGKPVDKRADVWAFGCVLYEMLTGKAAFAGDDRTTTLARVLERDPDMRKLPSGLSPSVRSTLELCLQKDVKKRLNHIGDVRLALEGEIASGSVVRAARRPLWRRALPVVAVIVALAAGFYLSNAMRPAAPVEQTAARSVTRFVVTPPASAPLTSLGGYDVAISPDGKRVAYFGENQEAGSIALYVRELDGLDARLIPGTEMNNLSNGTMNPFFSHDGKSIGYLDPDKGVMRVAVDGGPPVKMFDAPSPAFVGAAWGADETIVFSAGDGLRRVSAGGGSMPEVLTQGQPGIHASPVILPGGRAVLYGLIDGGAERVAALDLDTGESKIVLEGGQNAHYLATGHLVYARGNMLMAAPFDAKEVAVTREPVAVLPGVRHPSPATAADFALSDTGTLAYVPGSGETDLSWKLVWVDRDGEVVGRIERQSTDFVRDPVLSPEGGRLLLTLGQLNDGDLWSYDLRGRPPIRLAVTGDNRNAVWSPDGREVVFRSITQGNQYNIQKLPADGSVLTPRPLRTEPTVGLARAWSAAGELFVVRTPSGNADIVVMAADGTGGVREVVATEYAETDPALSPDGKWLAYVSTRTGRTEIWVQGYPDGVPVRISTNGGFEPRWSPDVRELYYRQGTALMAVAVRAEGQELSFDSPVELFRGFMAIPDATVSSYDVAPDGRFLMMQAPGLDAAGESIIVVQNWIEEIKARVPAR
jgi:Tol biopolymer transport system component